MPDSETHIRGGAAVGLVVAFVAGFLVFRATQSLQLAAIAGLGGGALTLVGAMLPDIDHHASKPRRAAVKTLIGVGSVVIIYAVWETRATIIDMVGAWLLGLLPPGVPMIVIPITVAGAGILVYSAVVEDALDKATGPHRTRTHDPKILLGTAVVLAGLLWTLLPPLQVFGYRLRPMVALGTPATLFIGTMTHVGQDWI